MADDRKRDNDEMRHEARLVTAPSQPKPDVALPAEARGLIAHQLREEYRRVLAEPLPDKFTKLLEELANSEGQTDSKPENTG